MFRFDLRDFAGHCLPRTIGLFSAPLLISLFSGCGQIIDPNNVVVAEVDGQELRQRVYLNHLRRLSEVDRPLIQTREDAVEALTAMIDDRILEQYAEDYRALGRIQIPREIAQEAYFAKYPENRLVFEIQDASLIDRSERDLEGIRATVAFGIDDEEARLYRDAALTTMAREAYEAGRIAVSEEELAAEYTANRSRLIRFERIDFTGIRFPTEGASSRADAADVLRRVQAGEDFDAIVDEFRQRDPSLVLESEFENDPRKPKFMTFWETVSGHEPGEVLLAFLPEFNVVTETAGGQRVTTPMPSAQLVLRVNSRTPEGTQSLDESRDLLLATIIRRKMMLELRDKHNVVVYGERLQDPAGFGDQFKGSQIQTTPGAAVN